MDQMAREIGDAAHFIFVYTREAHPEKGPDYPGELGLPPSEEEHPFPALTSIERKFENARTMRDLRQTPRTILVDDLDGSVHRQYSGGSNMSYILDHTGRLHYKANWTREAHLHRELLAAIEMRELKRDPERRVIPYYHEGISYDPSPSRERRVTDRFFESAPRS